MLRARLGQCARIGVLVTVGILLATTAALSADRVATLQVIYTYATDEAYNKHAVAEPDGTVFISTGDIDMEWLRDSSAVMLAYLRQVRSTPATRAAVRGAIARQARYILLDPYADAFPENYRIGERKFEVDSLLYPIRLAFRYWRDDRDRSIFTPRLQRAFALTLRVLRKEQHHTIRSRYRNALHSSAN